MHWLFAKGTAGLEGRRVFRSMATDCLIRSLLGRAELGFGGHIVLRRRTRIRPRKLANDFLLSKEAVRMLVLSRNEDSAVNIGANIKVKVLSIKRQSVKLGIEAPQSIRVWRDELPAKLDEQQEVHPSEQPNAGMRIVLVVEDDPG